MRRTDETHQFAAFSVASVTPSVQMITCQTVYSVCPRRSVVLTDTHEQQGVVQVTTEICATARASAPVVAVADKHHRLL